VRFFSLAFKLLGWILWLPLLALNIQN